MSKKYAKDELNDKIKDSKLDLPTRLENVLSDNRAWDIFGWKKPECVGDLVKYSEGLLLRLPNMGRKSVSWLQKELADKYNIYLGSEPELTNYFDKNKITLKQIVFSSFTEQGEKNYIFNSYVLSENTMNYLAKDLSKYFPNDERDIT